MAASDFEHLAADLSAYLDGELDAARAAAVDELLSRSADARRTLADLRLVRDGLRALPRVDAPRELASEVIARALAHQSTFARRRNTWRIVVQITGLAAGAAGFMYLGARIATPPLETSHTSALHFVPDSLRDRAPDPPAGDAVGRGADKSPEPGFLADGGARRGMGPAAEPVARDELTAALKTETPTLHDSPVTAPAPTVAFIARDSLVTGAGPTTYRAQDVQLGMPLAIENSPTVRVVVASRSQAEYEAASRLLAAYESRSDELVQRKLSNDAFQRSQTAQTPGAVGDDAVAGPELPTQIIGCSEASPKLVSDICSELNRVAPSQVSVALEFRGPQLQNMHAVAQQIQPAPDSEQDAPPPAWLGEGAALAAMKKDAAGAAAPDPRGVENSPSNKPAAPPTAAAPPAEAKSDAAPEVVGADLRANERARGAGESQREVEKSREAAPPVAGRLRTAGSGGAAASSPASVEHSAPARGGGRNEPMSSASRPAPQAPPSAARPLSAGENADEAAATREAEPAELRARQSPSRGVITRALISQIDMLGRRMDETMQQFNRALVEQNTPPPDGPPVSLNVILLPPPLAPASSQSAAPR